MIDLKKIVLGLIMFGLPLGWALYQMTRNEQLYGFLYGFLLGMLQGIAILVILTVMISGGIFVMQGLGVLE